MRLRHVIGAALLVIPGTSCNLGEPSESTSLNVYIEVDKVTLPRDNSMTITVTARNVGYDPLTLSGPSDCLLFVQAIDDRGLVVWSSAAAGACVGSTVTQTIEPGLDREQSFQWDGTANTGVRVPSATYLLRPFARLATQAYFGPGISIVVE